MPVTRGQLAFEQYKLSDEVKAHKQYIDYVADEIKSLAVFGLDIRRKYTNNCRTCEVLFVHGDNILRHLGTFSKQQAQQMYNLYWQALADALNTRIEIEEVITIPIISTADDVKIDKQQQGVCSKCEQTPNCPCKASEWRMAEETNSVPIQYYICGCCKTQWYYHEGKRHYGTAPEELIDKLSKEMGFVSEEDI